MKMLLRFFLPLFIVVSCIAYFTVPAAEYVTRTWFEKDLAARSKIIADAIAEGLAPLLSDTSVGNKKKKIALMQRMTENERVLAIGYCNSLLKLEFSTEFFSEQLDCREFSDASPHQLIIKELKNGIFHITTAAVPFTIDEEQPDGTVSSRTLEGKLLIVHDMSFAARRTQQSQKYLFLMFFGIGLVTATMGVAIARWSMKGWIRSVRSLLHGAQSSDIATVDHHEFLPILQDVRTLIRELESNRATRDELRLSWTPHSLKDILLSELSGDEILVVSNRQPYIHVKEDSRISVQFPASGLVTAVEPVMRACSGVWIAHGNGSGDREVVDDRDRVKVPPGKSEYEIHRLWLTSEEEKGYYYGFANEGLWPLCHMAHTRPIFRLSDWRYYNQVNQKFADAVVQDARSDNPVVLVQDYHFALVPKMIREKLPNATIITFWHVPWPNPEAFGICPWREEILEGLLGSSIMGFHIRFHQNNFVETVDRFLESRIDKENASISYHGRSSLIRSYPISIEWPPRLLADCKSMKDCQIAVREKNQIEQNVVLGIGVDRLDYTKGIIERFRSIERLFEKHPEWVGKFSFIQIAAPSRTSISAYKTFDEEVRDMALAVNTRFGGEKFTPIILKIEHHVPAQVYEYMRSAHLCFVSSLHDGMNLVAKEYIATREDESGVLILSMFAGASRELSEALIVNPYDIDQCADALYSALNMSLREQHERMHAMRSFLKDYNIYRWAGKMLLDAATIRRKHRLLERFSDRRFKTSNSLGSSQ